ncbi:MAG: hypothetical protein K2V38_25275, partial [Gemmataceae bacterium]|nr:hypothetical protein [Gemmataceae bacterium]
GLKEVPKDHWFRIAAGEVLVGQFANADKQDVLAFANHNPYEPQGVKLGFAAKVRRVEVFDRATRKWNAAELDAGVAAFTVEDYGVELVRVTR